MELKFYSVDTSILSSNDKICHYWGQLAGSTHRLYVIVDELENGAEEDNLELALTRLAYHVENYFVRIYDLRERAIRLLEAMTGQKTEVKKLKSPSKRKRARAIASLNIAAASAQAIVQLLDMLDADIKLRNGQTHDTFLNLRLYTGEGIFDPHDALLDLKGKPDAKAQIESVLREEINRLSVEYRDKVDGITKAAWGLLGTTEVHTNI
jgi:hypothetical protein